MCMSEAGLYLLNYDKKGYKDRHKDRYKDRHKYTIVRQGVIDL